MFGLFKTSLSYLVPKKKNGPFSKYNIWHSQTIFRREKNSNWRSKQSSYNLKTIRVLVITTRMFVIILRVLVHIMCKSCSTYEYRPTLHSSTLPSLTHLYSPGSLNVIGSKKNIFSNLLSAKGLAHLLGMAGCARENRAKKNKRGLRYLPIMKIQRHSDKKTEPTR